MDYQGIGVVARRRTSLDAEAREGDVGGAVEQENVVVVLAGGSGEQDIVAGAIEADGVGRRRTGDVVEHHLLDVGTGLDIEPHRAFDADNIKGVDGLTKGAVVAAGEGDGVVAATETHHEGANDGVVGRDVVAIGSNNDTEGVAAGIQVAGEEQDVLGGTGSDGASDSGAVDRQSVEIIVELGLGSFRGTLAAHVDIERAVAAGVVVDGVDTAGP